MVGAGLNELTLRHRYDPARHPAFVTERRCQRLDAGDASAFRQVTGPPALNLDQEALQRLADRLNYAERGNLPPESRASRTFARDQQRRVGSSLAERIDCEQRSGGRVAFVTLLPRHLDLMPSHTLAVTPTSWARALCQTLDRIKADNRLEGSGWSTMFLDCEYQQEEGVFRFHWHGFAAGDELAAFDLLRHRRNYRSPRPTEGEERDAVRHRTFLKRETLENLERLSIYPLKLEWQTRTVLSNQEGNRKRSWPRPTPPNLYAIERMFFDRWSIQDISLVRGLRVVGGLLQRSR